MTWILNYVSAVDVDGDPCPLFNADTIPMIRSLISSEEPTQPMDPGMLSFTLFFFFFFFYNFNILNLKWILNKLYKKLK
jgi:hypothetical protein